MAVQWLFEKGPLWLALLVLFVAMAIASTAGAWLHRRTGSDARDSADKEAEGYVLSGVLGLLALLVAFTFGMALNRFEVRRDLVVQEANALGVAYLRTSILDDPARLRALLRAYAEARLAYGLTGGETQRAAEWQAAQLRPLIWAEAVRLVGPSRQTPLPAFVLEPLNQAFSAATARRAALSDRLSSPVVLTLVLFMVAAAAVLGYSIAAASGRLHVASLAMFALFALAFWVILDLDRPRGGPIRVPQGAMADAVQLMTSGQTLTKTEP
jgi:hypothetical protein